MSTQIFKAFRERHELSQKELGEKLGLKPNPQARVSHIETGRRALSVDVALAFVRLARSMGEELTLEDLYSPVAPDVETWLTP